MTFDILSVPLYFLPDFIAHGVSLGNVVIINKVSQLNVCRSFYYITCLAIEKQH